MSAPADAPARQPSPLPLLRSVAGLGRSIALYPPGHRIIQQSVSETRRALDELLGEAERVRLELLGGVVHLRGDPCRIESRAGAETLERWAGSSVRCLEFERGVTDEELIETAKVLDRLASASPPTPSAARALAAAGVERVRLTGLVPVESALESFEWPDAPDSVSAESYAEALALARETVGGAFGGEALDLGGIEALLERISNRLLNDRVAMAEILAIKVYENYTFCHSVNVAALAIMLGRRVGLDDDRLAVIGEAALLHDIGKRQIPVEILQKAGRLSRRERRIIERHSVYGAEILACTPGLAALTATIALEHHRRFDGGGYPDLAGRVPHELSQIVSVVDIYEALTGARPYREPMAPEEACLILARMAGTVLNPALVRAFVSLVSFFPAGSVVRTSEDEIGIVVRTREAEPLHPVIELLDASTLERTGVIVDTAERDAAGEYRRHVEETVRHAPIGERYEALADPVT